MKKIKENKLYNSVREILIIARKNVQRSINFAMVEAYWSIGRLIVEDEQQGEKRAEYGKALPIHHALRGELSWTHYRSMLKVENGKAVE